MQSTILQLYPNARLDLIVNKENEKDYYFFDLSNQKLAIPKKDIKANEVFLLELLISKQNKSETSRPIHNHWQAFLEQKSDNIPIVSHQVQFIHFDFRKIPQQFEANLWFQTLIEAFPSIIEWFMINERRYTAIIHIRKNFDEDFDHLKAIILTLNSDFDTDTRTILGYPHTMSRHLPQKYKEELQIIDYQFQSTHINGFHLMSPLVLKSIGQSIAQNMSILNALKQTISNNSEYSQLIQALFEHQGNLSQTAEKLYIHRNTLTYRMQKFYKETGMQLQSLPDLVICYLCLPAN